MSSSVASGGTATAALAGAGARSLDPHRSHGTHPHSQPLGHARTRSHSHGHAQAASHRSRRTSQPVGARPPSFLSAATTTESMHSAPGAPVLQLSRKFVARRISEGETGRLKEELKCQACGKGYKHVSSLAKHLWEHTPEWNLTSKLLISKHQQVQLLEAASILVSMNEEDEALARQEALEASSREQMSEQSETTSLEHETAISSGSSPEELAEMDDDGKGDHRFNVAHTSTRPIQKTPRRRPSHVMHAASPLVGSASATDDDHQPPRASRRRSTFTRPRTLLEVAARDEQEDKHHYAHNPVFEPDD